MRPNNLVSATGTVGVRAIQGIFTEQVVRPTGLIDPVCIIRPIENQVDDLLAECHNAIAENQRVLVTTLTKRMAEDLSEYMIEAGLKVRYLHSDIDTLERIEIIRDLRQGHLIFWWGSPCYARGWIFLNALAAISRMRMKVFCARVPRLCKPSVVLRNIDGRVILYADKITDSLKYAMDETAVARTSAGIQQNTGYRQNRSKSRSVMY